MWVPVWRLKTFNLADAPAFLAGVAREVAAKVAAMEAAKVLPGAILKPLMQMVALQAAMLVFPLLLPVVPLLVPVRKVLTLVVAVLQVLTGHVFANPTRIFPLLDYHYQNSFDL